MLARSHTRLRTVVLLIALIATFGIEAVFCFIAFAKNQKTVSSRRLADGKDWMTDNLNVDVPQSYCYENDDKNCQRYGRLYTWESAQMGCRRFGNGWRLPTNDEWQKMAKLYGGVRGDSDDDGKSAYKALTAGGSAGFNVQFGGNRNSDDGQFKRMEAHGFYWTASETDAANAWFYNFGQARFLNRHSDGNKKMGLSVRCIRD